MNEEVMSNIINITEKYSNLPYMREKEALFLADLIVENDLKDLLELGFFHGKSSIYFGSILKGLGRGHLTTIDKSNSKDRNPNINQLLYDTDLEKYVTPIYAHRSFTWELAKMIRDGKKEVFDFCYLDGGHEFDTTMIAISCLNILLKPGGILVMDDLNYTVNNWPDTVLQKKNYCDEERSSKSLNLIFEKVLPELGFKNLDTYYKNGNNDGVGLAFGICRKK